MGGHNCTIAKVKLLLALVASTAVWAQPLSVYSEFAQIDASGKVTAPETPREILSPALVRNGFTSFQVVVRAPTGKEWWLYVGQNPENVLKIIVYRESGGGTLEPVELPRQGSGPEVFWMDLWTAANARTERVKVEPELFLNDKWVIYPIETRVMEARVPEEAPAQKHVCPVMASDVASAVARLQLRNAAQDGALAARAPKEELAKLIGFCDPPASPRWTESYLRIRDYLFRLR